MIDITEFQARVQEEWQAEVFDRGEGAIFSPDVPLKQWFAAEPIDDADPVQHARMLRRRARAEIRKYPSGALYCERPEISCYVDQAHGKWVLVTRAEFGAMPA